MIIKNQRGFTLIELLVVIAIIGILASIVLASLNSARSKGGDAAVKEDITGVRNQAEIDYSTDNNYSNVCTDATVINQMKGAASAAGITYALATLGTAGDATHVACHVSADNSAYAVSSPMKTSTQYWCVDSTGKSEQTTTALAGADVTCTP